MIDFWYPWHPLVFRKATRHLTPAQRDIYRELLDEYMITREPLPDDDRILARIAGVPDACFMHASSIVKAFFKPKNGLLHHTFCDTQLDVQDKRSRTRSEIGRKAAMARHHGNQTDTCIEHTSSNANAMHKHATRQDKTRQNSSKKERLSEKVSHETMELFEAFWLAYPNNRPRGNKLAALKKFSTAIKQGVTSDELITAASTYRQFCDTSGSFNQHVSTWLNQRGWSTDWMEQARSISGSTSGGNPAGQGKGESVSDITARIQADILARAGKAEGPFVEGAADGGDPGDDDDRVLLEDSSLVWQEE